MASFHHIEMWLSDLTSELPAWRWLLAAVGLALETQWEDGESWATTEDCYLPLTTAPRVHGNHDRRRPGVNHLALTLESREAVDALMKAGPEHGWQPLYQNRYPFAGGPEHYASWLENEQGYKIELVAQD